MKGNEIMKRRKESKIIVNCSSLKTSIGRISYVHDGNSVLAVDLKGKIPLEIKRIKNVLLKKKTLKGFEKEIKSYLKGKLRKFRTKVKPVGINGFTLSVLHSLAKVPYGKTLSYSNLASRVKRPKAFRAVGTACGKNPCPIIIPCHRVIKNDGSLGGFGCGLPMKKRLLKIEGISF